MRQRLFYTSVVLFLIFTEYSFSQDTTDGIVWEPPIQLSPDSLDNGPPEMAVQGDTVHITWWNSGLHYPYVRSTDGGKTFEPLRELALDSIGFVGNCAIFSTGSRLHSIFAAQKINGTPYFRYHMFSDDHGDSWSLPVRFSDTLICYSATGRGDTVIFRSSKTGQFYLLTTSIDGGITWSTKPCPILLGNNPQLALTKDYLHLVKGYVFDSAGYWAEYVIQYRRSTDLGKTWSDSIPLSTVNYSRAYEPSMTACEQGDSSMIFTAWHDEKYGCLSWVGCSVLGRISRDNGISFLPEQRFDERPAGYMISNAVRGNDLVIAWKDDLPDGGIRIRVSFDNGLNWCPVYPISSGIEPRVAISDNAIHITWMKLILYPDSSSKFQIFYRRGKFLSTGIHYDRDNLFGFRLEQNYPNPFNPKTVIKYKVQSTEYVSIKVYDVFGREIKTLVNEKKTPGEYEVEWNAENISSGVYYYRFTSENYNAVGKAILLK